MTTSQHFVRAGRMVRVRVRARACGSVCVPLCVRWTGRGLVHVPVWLRYAYACVERAGGWVGKWVALSARATAMHTLWPGSCITNLCHGSATRITY